FAGKPVRVPGFGQQLLRFRRVVLVVRDQFGVEAGRVRARVVRLRLLAGEDRLDDLVEVDGVVHRLANLDVAERVRLAGRIVRVAAVDLDVHRLITVRVDE